MPWRIRLGAAFEPEFMRLSEQVQDEILTLMGLLKEYGPELGRPRADTLKGSKHPNLKELRFSVAGGVWRVTYAFDPRREGILLAAGNKVGVAQARFYKQLIAKSDARYDDHLSELKRRG